ncbi:hypothetical protein PFMALIP_05995 [Plasmodium falciparum MaliPS096_E11]|uniref:Surface antigen n=1 Tax=Plasmodium falciparum MaliPS096_E11 TaxID=1036727 RepID=A0A024WFT0_PLAFA|nr:hypothetical protein PFMALIP_05995 [Plasmodium falciparum MaliPS096_E11]
MKVHSINILMFSLPLNILVYNQRNYYITPRHTETNRSLCECELYSPANYDSDPEMKRVMQQFEDRTTQRFHEYDERLQSKRMQCKEQCDKEIQKIILKDKLEKQMVEQLTTLETNITTKDIPTCVCKKSLTDKTEKVCLKCGYGLGSVAPNVGLIAEVALNVWKDAEIVAAIAAAKEAGAVAGKAAGDIAGAAEVIDFIESTFYINELGGTKLQTLFTAKTYTNVTLISRSIQTEYSRLGCGKILFSSGTNKPICNFVNEGILTTTRAGIGGSPKNFIETTAQNMVSDANRVAEAKAAEFWLW